MKGFAIAGIVASVVVCSLITACDASAFEPTTLEKQVSSRVWQRNEHGVRYFKTCVEGYLFIGTYSTHGYIQLAGPIGKCYEGQ